MIQTDTHNKHPRTAEVLVHVIGWSIVFAFPLTMMSRNGIPPTWRELTRGTVTTLSFFIVFYANYFLLIPHLLFEGKSKSYLLWNIGLIALMTMGVHYTHGLLIIMPRLHEGPPPFHMIPPKWGFFLRHTFSLILTAGLSVAIKLSLRWNQIEKTRREAEKIRTEAELKNLRNQLNPHFLLNTLNNIYALIAFDADKAQNAVQELSRLLRHVLYDNQQNTVPLCSEIDFIRNYIELMRIRLAANVTVETHFDISPDSRTPIAPLIFISLIENAFKHGISPTQPSHIHIRFCEKPEEVKCEIVNSYHPKSTADKSGSGIGLEQVRKRLELIYPGRYTWKQGVNRDKTEYFSLLTIQTGNQPDNKESHP